jgi:4-amino-4-deoxy-L-arabinose transferase-like glycosyltransferase
MRHPGLRIALVAIIAFLVLGGFEAWRDSATFDEPVYVSSGVIAIVHHDLADNAEHPPLFKVLAALPVLAANPVIPGDGHWDSNNERSYSATFSQAQLKAGTLRSVTFLSRIVPLLETVLVALALFELATLLFGGWSGLVAALLWLGNPLVLGVGHLDGVDIPLALTTVLVALATVRWWQQPNRRALGWLGLACGAVVSAQTTGLLVAAMAVATVLVVQRRRGLRGWRAWRAVVGVSLVTWVFVWAVYLILNPSVALHSWVILPQPYVEGIRYLASHDTGGSPGFLFGTSWTGSKLWFWPGTLLVKLSAPILLLSIAGPLVLLRLLRSGHVRRGIGWQTLAAVVAPALVLFVFELPNPRTLGARYLLPSIALWAVVASPIALVAGRRAMAASVSALLALAAVITATSFPDSISYTSPPFTPGYRNATDSNVDWGQNFGQLVTWSRGRHPYVAYFGPRGISWSTVPGAKNLRVTPPSQITGWVAASASDLTSTDRSSLAWLRAYCPVGTLGGSILLYHFTSPPTPAAGPAAPAEECQGNGRSSVRS